MTSSRSFRRRNKSSSRTKSRVQLMMSFQSVCGPSFWPLLCSGPISYLSWVFEATPHAPGHTGCRSFGFDRAVGFVRVIVPRPRRVSATPRPAASGEAGSDRRRRIVEHIWVFQFASRDMGLLKAYNGLLGAVVTVFGAYHVLFPYHAIELYGVYDPLPPPPAPSQSGARLYVHDDTPPRDLGSSR